MVDSTEIEELFVTTFEVDGRVFNASVRIEHDGVEHVGHLWFTDSEWEDDDGIRDHGAIPGKAPNEILMQAQELSPHDLVLRYRRALADKRRYHGLRRVTEEVLENIRHLNKVATSMRAGLLAIEEAAAEIDSTERRLHDMIDQLKHFAGVAAQ
jgi:hypothetical protein